MPPIVGTSGNDYLNGTTGDDQIQGLAGRDILNGRGGRDLMEGGAENDSYFIDDPLDEVRESIGGGFDIVYSTINYALAAGQEIEVLSTGQAFGTVTVSLTGNEFNNNIVGNDGINWLRGEGGIDYLQGYAGNDQLDGGTGNDIMEGGAGNDIYYVDHALDRPREVIGAGFDRVYATTTFALGAGQEIELLSTLDASATTSINFTGNEFNNNIVGNDGINWLTGGAGADYLQAYAGNDRLDGGLGADIMEGGLGNDIYYVDDNGDRPRETVGAGFDRVYASSTYTLTAGQEIELLSTVSAAATTAINLTGNEFNNNVVGNAGVNWLFGGGGMDFLEGHGGNDRLDGGTGADIMEGGAGNDTYYVDDALDRPRETAGNGLDTVYAGFSYTLAAGQELEILSTGNAAGTASLDFTGNEFNNNLVGNNGVNILNGGAGDDFLEGHGGADRLDGGVGQDVLVGGSGADVYRFGAVAHSALGVGDTINGFESGIDRIDLAAIDADTLTGGSQYFLYIGSQAFTGRAGELRYLQTDATTFHLYGDTNGDGAADFHVRVNGNGLAATDFSGVVLAPANQPPLITSGSTASVAENSIAATIVYQTVASDPDGNPLSYSLSGTDAALLTIDSSGAVRLIASANYEARSSYSFTVQAADGLGGADTQAVTLSVSNVNEIPVITSGTTATIAENSPTSTIVYQTVASDPDGTALSYTLSGADASLFSIDASGALRFLASPNFEARSSYSVTVNASDGSLAALRNVVVTVTDVNEGSGSTPVITETAAANDSIGAAQSILRSQLEVATNPNLPDQSLPSIQINGNVSPNTDQDFFSITLEAGELLILDVDGTVSLDAFLRVFGPTGTQIASNDDAIQFDTGSNPHTGVSHNMDSLVRFRAPTSGTYTFSIASYVDDDGVSTSSGAYTINVSVGPSVSQDVINQENVDSLVSGSRWNTANVTYGFTTSAADYGAGEGDPEKTINFEALNAAQQAVTRTSLGLVSQYTTLTFSELAGSPGSAQMRLAQSDDPDTAHAYYPGTGDGGDAWFRNSAPSSGGSPRYDNPVAGNYGYLTFIHEIGHALGLKHGHESPALSPDRDSMEYSVMTYRGYIGASDETGYTNETWGFAQSFMMYDIAALQQIYGANWSTNSGDTTYRWSSSTGAFSINNIVQWTPGGNRVFQTVWDGGGTDTYDLSNYTNAVTIDLRPGEWTTTSQVQLAHLGGGNMARGNVANALLHNDDLRSLIENAIGGSGNDTLIANEAANRLTGGTGIDTFAWRSLEDAADPTGPDRILDFVTGSGEQIDLSAIDAIAGTGPNDQFNFVGTNAFTGTAGELRYMVDVAGVNIYGDVNGDAVADLHIVVNGTSIVSTDFIF